MNYQKIHTYDENMINSKIEKYKKIIANLNTLKCSNVICKILDFLC